MHRGASQTRHAVCLPQHERHDSSGTRETNTHARAAPRCPLGNEERGSGLPRANAGASWRPGSGAGLRG